jgi:hypothetical protein
MMSKENYHRFPDDEKVKGVDYQFYREMLAGEFDEDINAGMDDPEAMERRSDLIGALIKA